jgi:FKBP-type peptidyl-prolyl cis-trans isomerase FkpA
MSTRSARAERRVSQQRRQRITIFGIIFFLLVIIAYFAFSGFLRKSQTPDLTKTASGLQFKDLKIGNGDPAKNGDTVVVNYTGWLQNGNKFDSSYDRNKPFEFTLGAGQVIKGWDEGVAGMKAGGKRRLIIPPELAYGSQGAGNVIPPGATLTFEVELLNIK